MKQCLCYPAFVISCGGTFEIRINLVAYLFLLMITWCIGGSAGTSRQAY